MTGKLGGLVAAFALAAAGFGCGDDYNVCVDGTRPVERCTQECEALGWEPAWCAAYPPPDGGLADGGPRDAGPFDGGAREDGGSEDAGPEDAGSEDGGPRDAGRDAAADGGPECTPETEGEDCPGTSCDPSTLTCTGTPVGSVGPCDACLADSECADEDDRCVPMWFGGDPRPGGHCLRRVDADCAPPYAVPTAPRESLSGDTARSYCGVDEAVTTCEAVRDLEAFTTCGADEDCGAPTLEDGVCGRVSGIPGQCTYRCSLPEHCAGRPCAGDPSVCGGTD